MLGIDERALRVIWTVFLFGLILTVVYFIRNTLILFAASIFFAYALWPMVSLIERFLPRRRTVALALVYTAFMGVLVVVGFLLIPRFIAEATSLVTSLPKLMNSGKFATLPLPNWLEPLRAQIIGFMHHEATQLQAHFGPLLQAAGTHILSGVASTLPFILLPILAFFFLKDARHIRVSLLGAVDHEHDRTMVDLILNDIHSVLKRYIRALVLLAIVSFSAWAVFLGIMQYQYELLLAGIAGILEFIPVIGPAAALVILLIVSAITGSSLIGIAVFWGAFRLFQDYILNPYLMSAGIEMHPLLVLFGVLAGEAIGGIPGMFFSVPAIAILRVIYGHLRTSYSRRNIEPETFVEHTRH
ncbi:MAG: AI-2E family transporter [Bryobacteraceae bacterium]